METPIALNDKRAKTVSAKPGALKLLDEIRMAIGPDLSKVFGNPENSGFDCAACGHLVGA